MSQTTDLRKKLQAGPLVAGEAVVTLAGVPVGRIVRESSWWLAAYVGEHSAGGGRNVPNALRALAVNYPYLKEAA